MREQYQRERPSLESLVRSGQYEEPVKQGEYFALLELAARLKNARVARGLSLAQVASRSGIDKAAISRLENGQNPNPTLATLETLARAIGARLRFRLESLTPAAR